MCVVSSSKNIRLCAFVIFFSFFASVESPNEERFTGENRTSESFTKVLVVLVSERVPKELRLLYLALARCYTKIKQIRALEILWKSFIKRQKKTHRSLV